MKDMYEIVAQHPLLAILRNIPFEKTVDYVQAIRDGGVSFFEVALNSPRALEQIALLRRQFGSTCLIGAGTAVTPLLCRQALEAGAQFLLTPGTPEGVLQYCRENSALLLPGVLTPTDVALCCAYGFETMKLFPADAMPAGYVKSLQGPFDRTNYMAIGGVTPENLSSFFDAGYLSAGLASAILPKEVVAFEDWSKGSAYVQALVQRARKTVR